jgi:hypothetical protein
MGDAEVPGGESAPGNLTPFLAPLVALQGLLARFENRGVIIAESPPACSAPLGSPRIWMRFFCSIWNEDRGRP